MCCAGKAKLYFHWCIHTWAAFHFLIYAVLVYQTICWMSLAVRELVFEFRVLYHIPQQQQYIQSHSVLLRTSWHKGCMEMRPARERQNSFKKHNISQCFWAQDVFLGWRQGGEHSPSSLSEASLSAYIQQDGRHQSAYKKSSRKKPPGTFRTCSFKWAALTDCRDNSPPFRHFWINADRPQDYMAHEITLK